MGWISPHHSPPHCWQDIFRQGMLGWNHRPPRIVHMFLPLRLPAGFRKLLIWFEVLEEQKTNVEMEQQSRKTYKENNEFAWKKKVGRQLFCYGAWHLFMPLIWAGALPFGKAIPMPKVEISFRQILPSGLFFCFVFDTNNQKYTPKKLTAGTWKDVLEKEAPLQYSPIFGFQSRWFSELYRRTQLSILPPPLCVKIKAQPTNQPYSGHFPPIFQPGKISASDPFLVS